jgi:hypothetical protein
MLQTAGGIGDVGSPPGRFTPASQADWGGSLVNEKRSNPFGSWGHPYHLDLIGPYLLSRGLLQWFSESFTNSAAKGCVQDPILRLRCQWNVELTCQKIHPQSQSHLRTC